MKKFILKQINYEEIIHYSNLSLNLSIGMFISNIPSLYASFIAPGDNHFIFTVPDLLRIRQSLQLYLLLQTNFFT